MPIVHTVFTGASEEAASSRLTLCGFDFSSLCACKRIRKDPPHDRC